MKVEIVASDSFLKKSVGWVPESTEADLVSDRIEEQPKNQYGKRYAVMIPPCQSGRARKRCYTGWACLGNQRAGKSRTVGKVWRAETHKRYRNEANDGRAVNAGSEDAKTTFSKKYLTNSRG